MEHMCHRCSQSVSAADTFCPHCGAPQLHFDASSRDEQSNGQAQPLHQGRPGQISWHDAIVSSFLIALPAGILCGLPLLAAGSLLWVMGGASLVILLYKKKRPMALLNGRSGLRIGSLAGVLIAYISVAVAAFLRVLQRFPLHIGKTIDRDYEAVISQSMTIFQTSPDTQAQMRAFFHFMLTPDGRAAWSLMNMATITVMTVFFAALGGYIGVRLFSGRRLA